MVVSCEKSDDGVLMHVSVEAAERECLLMNYAGPFITTQTRMSTKADQAHVGWQGPREGGETSLSPHSYVVRVGRSHDENRNVPTIPTSVRLT
jgi:hypothetical protein